MILPPPHAALVFVTLMACAPQGEPAFHFKVETHDPVFFNDMATDQLRHMRPDYSLVNPNDFPVTSGVTQGRISLQTSIRYRLTPNALGEYCAAANDVEVTLSYTAEVHIASEYKPGSCRYAETKAHEMRHVKTDIDTIREYLPEIQKRAAARAAKLPSIGPVTEEERDEVKSILINRIQGVLQDELRQIDGSRSLRQQAIDTPAEYTRLSRACPGEPIR